MNDKIELIKNYNSELYDTDPELSKILDDFFTNQVLKECSLTDKERIIVTLACIIANQSKNLYEDILKEALDIISPVEIKEIIYQSIIYVGLTKAYEFLNITNQIFIENKIKLPLDNQSTIEYEDRLKTGYDLQVKNFGKDFIDNSINNAPPRQRHIWDFISSFAYGDFYTRSGLNDKYRELISFTFILSLRGCENQLRIHAKGNIEVGNTKEKLLNVITALVVYNGFPRTHNALAIVNEICK